jgi:hypothetical protein
LICVGIVPQSVFKLPVFEISYDDDDDDDDDDDNAEILKNDDKPPGNTSTPAEQPAASNSRTAHISAATVPSSSVDGHSSKALHYSVDGGSSNMSVQFSPTVGHSQPSTSGTARRSLLNSCLMSENAQGRLYLALVPTVAQQTDRQVSCLIFL